MSSEHSLMSQQESPSSHGNPPPSSTTTTTTPESASGSGEGSGRAKIGAKRRQIQVSRKIPVQQRQSSAAVEKSEGNSAADAEGKLNLLENIPQIAEHFEVVSKIGEGTFSSVYLASLREDKEEQFAIKHLVPTSSSARIENEIYCLEKMGTLQEMARREKGRDHIIPLIAYVRHRDHVALILPYFKHDKFMDYLPLMGVEEVRLYVRALFEALRNVHSHGIIHRDVKPSNFLYNRAARRFQLVDFGLAHLQSQTREDRGSILKAVQPKGRGSTASSSHTSTTVQPKGRGSTASSSHTSTTSAAVIPAAKRPHPVAPPPASFRKQLHQRTLSATKPTRQPVKTKRHPSSTVPAATTLPAVRGGGGTRGGATGQRSRSAGDTIRICPMRHKINFVCKLCMGRNNQVAPRAGTPGFRPPEVLLKYPQQTTAVDMWSAGVVLLCLLSKRYPFFKAHDDMSAMAQIVGLFGSEECIKAAKSYKKELICCPEVPPLDLRALCSSLRNTSTNSTTTSTTTATSTLSAGEHRHQAHSDTTTKGKLSHSGSKDRIGPGEIDHESRSSPSKRKKLNSGEHQKQQQPSPRKNPGSKDRNGVEEGRGEESNFSPSKRRKLNSSDHPQKQQPPRKSEDQSGPEERGAESHSSPSKLRRRPTSRLSRTRSLEPAVALTSSSATSCLASATSADDGDGNHLGSWNQVPDSIYDLMLRCLDLNPETRITAEQALSHHFLADHPHR